MPESETTMVAKYQNILLEVQENQKSRVRRK